MNTREKILYLTQSAIVASLYVILTYISFAFGLDKSVIQVRFSEALCVLGYFIPAAVPGLFAGCLLANILTGSMIFDVVFGSVATLIGAYFGSKIKNKWLVPVPTVLANTLIIPPVLVFEYGVEQTYVLATAGVFLGEIVSAYIMGMLLLFAVQKHGKSLFKENKK